MAALSGRAHGEFIHVHLANNNGPCRLQALDNVGVIGRHISFQDFRGTCCLDTSGRHVIFNGNRHACQRSGMSLYLPGRL